MVVVNTLSEEYFSLNGLPLAKIYQPLKQGEFHIGLYNINDSKQQLVESTDFKDFIINGVSYDSLEETVGKLLDVVFLSDFGDLSIKVSEKTDKGGYGGTTQDLKEELDNKLFTGALTYQTLEDLKAVDPMPLEGTPAKVSNDSNSLNNGYYSVVNGVFVLDKTVYKSEVDAGDVSEGVNGYAVADYALGKEDYVDFKNIVDYRDFVKGEVSSNGNRTGSINWASVNVKVEPNTEYFISGFGSVSSSAFRLVFFANGLANTDNLISGVKAKGSDLAGFSFVTPVNCDIIGVNIVNEIDAGVLPIEVAYKDSLQIEKGNIKTVFSSFLGSIKEELLPDLSGKVSFEDLFDYKNIVNPEGYALGAVFFSGGKNTSVNWLSLDVGVEENKEYTFSGFGKIPSSEEAVRVTFHSGEGGSSDKIGELLDVYNDLSPLTFTTPFGCVLARFNIVNEISVGADLVNNNYVNSVQLEEGSKASDFVSYKGQIKSEFLPESENNQAEAEDSDLIYLNKVSEESYLIYLPMGDSMFLRLGFVRIVNEGDFIDIYRLNTGFLATKSNNVFSLGERVLLTGIWENAIYTEGEGYTDALGSSHGWEKQTSFTGLVNGLFVEDLEVGVYELKDFSLFQKSNLFSVDGSEVVAECLRNWNFKSNKVNLRQNFKWKTSIGISKNSYTAMCPVMRKSNNGTGNIQITTKALKDNDYEVNDVSELGFINNAYDRTDNTVKRIVIGGELFSVDMHIKEKFPFKEDQSFYVQNTELYNKLYYAHGSGQVEDGDEWVMDVDYTFNVKK